MLVFIWVLSWQWNYGESIDGDLGIFTSGVVVWVEVLTAMVGVV